MKQKLKVAVCRLYPEKWWRSDNYEVAEVKVL